jgi:hypothetical protein
MLRFLAIASRSSASADGSRVAASGGAGHGVFDAAQQAGRVDEIRVLRQRGAQRGGGVRPAPPGRVHEAELVMQRRRTIALAERCAQAGFRTGRVAARQPRQAEARARIGGTGVASVAKPGPAAISTPVGASSRASIMSRNWYAGLLPSCASRHRPAQWRGASAAAGRADVAVGVRCGAGPVHAMRLAPVPIAPAAAA